MPSPLDPLRMYPGRRQSLHAHDPHPIREPDDDDDTPDDKDEDEDDEDDEDDDR